MRRLCNTACISTAGISTAQTKVFSSRLLFAGLFVLGLIVPCLLAQDSAPKMSVGRPVAFAVSPPLRELAGGQVSKGYVLPTEDPVAIPGFYFGNIFPSAADPVEQSSPGGQSNISIGLNLQGVGAMDCNCGELRSDANAAVGDTQVVEWVNVQFAVYDKQSGAQELAPTFGNALWQSLGGPCAETNDGDPIAQFDKVNHRWLMTQNDFAARNEYQGPHVACIAVSTTADATGSYYLYEYLLGSDFPDYPHWGIWPDGYYQAQNNGSFGEDNSVGALVCAYNSAKLIVCNPTAEKICFQLTPRDHGLLPGDVDSATPPPADQDEFFVGSYDIDQTNNHIYLYSMHPDFANPGLSTFSGGDLGNPITVPVYVPFCPSPFQPACIPQQGTDVKLGSLGDRLMYRLAYWNDAVPPNAVPQPAQHWYVSHVTTASGGQAGERWYEFRAPMRTATISDVSLYQSGTYAPDGNYRWMGSIAQDKMGDIALGYSVASSTLWNSIGLTGRVPTDPLGQMEAETIAIAGTGSSGPYSSWGDYSSMAIDADGCTFWYAQQYSTIPESMMWQTRLVSFRFNGCR